MEEIKGVTFKRGLDHNYMVIQGDETRPSDYQVKMMTENVIMNILKLEIHMVDGHFDYYYEISSKQSLKSVYEHKQISHRELIELLDCTLKAYIMVSEYMLDEEHLILNPKYIFLNPETMNMEFLFYPEYKASIEDNFSCLSEFILDKVDHTDKGAVMLAYNLYKQIKSENYTLANIRSIIDQTNESNITEQKSQVTSEEFDDINMENLVDNTTEEPAKSIFSGLFGKKKSGNSRKEKKTKSAYDTEKELFNNTNQNSGEVEREQTVSDDSGSEDILVKSINEVPAGAVIHRLVRKGAGKESVYNITGFPVTIGSDKKQADFFIKDASVDKMHVRIVSDNEAIFIQNLSESKQAFINEMPLAYEESIMLESGDDIRLGKIRLEYR